MLLDQIDTYYYIYYNVLYKHSCYNGELHTYIQFTLLYFPIPIVSTLSTSNSTFIYLTPFRSKWKTTIEQHQTTINASQ